MPEIEMEMDPIRERVCRVIATNLPMALCDLHRKADSLAAPQYKALVGAFWAAWQGPNLVDALQAIYASSPILAKALRDTAIACFTTLKGQHEGNVTSAQTDIDNITAVDKP